MKVNRKNCIFWSRHAKAHVIVKDGVFWISTVRYDRIPHIYKVEGLSPIMRLRDELNKLDDSNVSPIIYKSCFTRDNKYTSTDAKGIHRLEYKLHQPTYPRLPGSLLFVSRQYDDYMVRGQMFICLTGKLSRRKMSFIKTSEFAIEREWSLIKNKKRRVSRTPSFYTDRLLTTMVYPLAMVDSASGDIIEQ